MGNEAKRPTVEDNVNHPAHYGGADDPYEAIKVIEAWGLGFHLGNAVKYIARAGKKGDRDEDLRKARWYIDRLIDGAEEEAERVPEVEAPEDAGGDGPDDADGWLRSSRWHTGPRVEFQMDDEEGAVPARIDLDRLAAFIHLHRISGRTVFVHCTAGINRSGLVLGYFLCCDGGLSGEEAIALIRSRRKSHGTPMKPLSNNSFADALRRWFPREVARG